MRKKQESFEKQNIGFLSYIKPFIKCLLYFIILFTIVGLVVISFKYKAAAKVIQNENLGEKFAEEYLMQLEEQTITIQETEPQKEPEPSDLDYADHTIDENSHVVGYVDAVLEIPAIQFRQSILSGTQEEIDVNLENWLSVAARPNYKIGSTHYCIYIHSTSTSDITISQAQYKVGIDDYAILTSKDNVYLYQFVDVYPEWRDICTTEIVDNMTLPSDELYIFTCGHGEWTGKNTVLKAKLYKKYQRGNWENNKDIYIDDYKEMIEKQKEEKAEPIRKKELSLDVKTETFGGTEASVVVSIQNKEYVDCSIALTDKDGYLVPGMENPRKYEGEPMRFSNLTEGEYYLGVYTCDERYNKPAPYKLTISKQTADVQTMNDVLKEENIEKGHNNMLRTVARCISIISLCVWIIFGVQALISKKNADR